MVNRIIPSTGEKLPVIGLGTWQTFDAEKSLYPALTDVLKVMHKNGGRLIDSSPMYGLSESVVGDLTRDLTEKNDFFYATKVWTSGRDEGIRQMQSSLQKMGRVKMDLMQIHNLVDWQTHLKTLRKWKEEEKIRYIGITHYTDSSHDELEKIIRTEKIDFVQFNYSIDNRHAEKRLLPAAAEKGVATIINRPYGEGRLFQKIKNKPIPQKLIENKFTSWSQIFLNYIISHPAVTCVIPATSNPEHAADNFRSGTGVVSSESVRQDMIRALD